MSLDTNLSLFAIALQSHACFAWSDQKFVGSCPKCVMFSDIWCLLASLHFCSHPWSIESIETQLHSLRQHLCTLLLDDGECYLQERLLWTKTTPFVDPDNYLPSCPHMTQHYLEQLPVTWCCLHYALLPFGILCSYTYSTDYQHQLQNSSHYFRIMTFISVIFEWPKY